MAKHRYTTCEACGRLIHQDDAPRCGDCEAPGGLQDARTGEEGSEVVQAPDTAVARPRTRLRANQEASSEPESP